MTPFLLLFLLLGSLSNWISLAGIEGAHIKQHAPPYRSINPPLMSTVSEISHVRAPMMGVGKSPEAPYIKETELLCGIHRISAKNYKKPEASGAESAAPAAGASAIQLSSNSKLGSSSTSSKTSSSSTVGSEKEHLDQHMLNLQLRANFSLKSEKDARHRHNQAHTLHITSHNNHTNDQTMLQKSTEHTGGSTSTSSGTGTHHGHQHPSQRSERAHAHSRHRHHIDVDYVKDFYAEDDDDGDGDGDGDGDEDHTFHNHEESVLAGAFLETGQRIQAKAQVQAHTHLGMATSVGVGVGAGAATIGSAAEMLNHVGTYAYMQDIKPFSIGEANAEGQFDKMYRGDVSYPENIEFVLAQEHFFSCVDPREKYALLGALGGDVGEFILAMAAYEKMSRIELTLEKINKLLQDYLRVLPSRGKKYFYMHTSQEALDALSAATGASDPMKPSGIIERNKILQVSGLPAHVGCKHLSAMIEAPQTYGVRGKMVEDVIKCYLNVLFDYQNPLRAMLLYVVSSDAAEKVDHPPIARVRTPNKCQSAAPLLVPNLGEGKTKACIFHDKHVRYYRQDLARFFAFYDASVHAKRLFKEMMKMTAQTEVLSVYCGEQEYEVNMLVDESLRAY